MLCTSVVHEWFSPGSVDEIICKVCGSSLSSRRIVVMSTVTFRGLVLVLK